MTLRDITLTATVNNWRLFMKRKADPAFLSFQEKVFERDSHTCQFCGFQARQHFDVINCDGNYRNNRMSNLATACSFCTQCFFLEAIGRSDFGGGSLICLPEMTQGELNALCHVLFASMLTGNGYSSQAKNIYRSLRLRVQTVEKKLGDGLSNPAMYAQLLIDANVAQARELHQSLAPKLRVLPIMNKFTDQVLDWANEGLADLAIQ